MELNGVILLTRLISWCSSLWTLAAVSDHWCAMVKSAGHDSRQSYRITASTCVVVVVANWLVKLGGLFELTSGRYLQYGVCTVQLCLLKICGVLSMVMYHGCQLACSSRISSCIYEMIFHCTVSLLSIFICRLNIRSVLHCRYLTLKQCWRCVSVLDLCEKFTWQCMYRD